MPSDPVTPLHALVERWKHSSKAQVLRDCADDLDAALRAQGWQPIATAPTMPNCHRVLTYDGERTTVGYQDAYYAEGGRGYTGQSGWVNDEGEQFNPTHWMPLPPPPETQP